MAEDDRFYVKTLRMQNFRCFEDVELGPFDPSFNLLVGENGAGKSSVLVALTYIFAPFGVEKDDPFPRMGDFSDIRRSENVEDILRRNLPFRAVLQARFFPSTTVSAQVFRKETDSEVIIQEEPEYNRDPTENSPNLLIHGPEEQAADIDAIPLVAFYRANRRFSAEKFDSTVPEKFTFPRFAGVRGWSNAGLESQALTKWLNDETIAKYQGDARYYLGQVDSDDFEMGYFLDLVVGAIATGVEGAKNIEYRGAVGEIVVNYENGRKQKLSEMSDGQRGIVCLFADLARRMCILNGPRLRERTLLDTPGLVLIDEIDLHLHPKWQRQIVPALKRVFPKIQFFATTHSPQVIGECKPEEIVLLTPQGQKRPAGSFGMDSNWVLECVMDAEGRNPEIGRRIKSLFELIESERLDEAKAEIKRLREELPEVAPDIVSAEAYIWNLEHGPDEAAE